jgi:4-amino-4-deoxy-L-arabinose transferase-like glycosyltransferase
MWMAQFLMGGDKLFSYFAKIPSIVEFSYVSGDGLNAVLYSVQPAHISIRYDFLPPRNSGFAWEPGGFAAFLSVAIFFNLFLFQRDKHSRIRFWVLVTALISTQSTTGYLVFLVILIFYFYNKRQKTVILLWPLIIALVVMALSLPFMSEKIISLINEAKMVEVIVERTIGREESLTPQRFTSFVIAFRDFLDNPIIGLGGANEESWTYKIGANVSSITGIGNLLAQHGLVGFIFFLLICYNTSAFFSKAFNYKGKPLFFIIVFFISISYGIILLPVFMGFWMFKFFTPNGIQDGEVKIPGKIYPISKQGFNQS